jgi:hypothetical protein
MCARARGTNNAYSVRVRVCVRVCVCLRLYITAVHTRARTHARTHLMHARAHPPTLLAGITTAISVQERMARPADYSCMLNAVFGTLVVVCAKPIARARLRLGRCVGFRCGGYSVRTLMRIEIRADSPLILRAFAFRTAPRQPGFRAGAAT